MGVFSNISISILDFHYDGVSADKIAELVSKEYGTVITEAMVREVIDREANFMDDYDDSMDGDEASALASAGFGTDEDYGYFGD